MGNPVIYLLLLSVFVVLYAALHFALASHPLFEGRKKYLWILPLLLLSFGVIKLGETIGHKMHLNIQPTIDTTNVADTTKPITIPLPQPKIVPKPDTASKGQVKPNPNVVKKPVGDPKTPSKGGVVTTPVTVTPTPIPVKPVPVTPTSPPNSPTSPEDEPPVRKGEMNTGIKKK